MYSTFLPNAEEFVAWDKTIIHTDFTLLSARQLPRLTLPMILEPEFIPSGLSEDEQKLTSPATCTVQTPSAPPKSLLPVKRNATQIVEDQLITLCAMLSKAHATPSSTVRAGIDIQQLRTMQGMMDDIIQNMTTGRVKKSDKTDACSVYTFVEENMLTDKSDEARVIFNNIVAQIRTCAEFASKAQAQRQSQTSARVIL